MLPHGHKTVAASPDIFSGGYSGTEGGNKKEEFIPFNKKAKVFAKLLADFYVLGC